MLFAARLLHVPPLPDHLSLQHLASLLLRRMIEFALDHARVKRYRYAAQHLLSCAQLDAAIDDYGEHPTHRAYVAELRERHGRKWGFWQDVDPQEPSD